MKRRAIAIAALCLALAGCGTQKRAERHLRRAVALCPELVQMTAHHIDTLLAVVPSADSCRITFCEHPEGKAFVRSGFGTFSAVFDTAGIAISYTPDTVTIRYADTILLPQVADCLDGGGGNRRSPWQTVALVLFGFGFGFAVMHATDRLIDDIRRN